LDLGNLHIMGHSYGGSTAIYTGCHDSRITGHVILLDPWFYPLPDNLDLTKLKKPFLCVKSENFNKIQPHWNNDKLMEAIWNGPTHKDTIQKSFVCVVKNAGHNSGTDVSFLTPIENWIPGMITTIYKDQIFELYDVMRLLITEFLMEFDVEKFKNKAMLPEKYKDILKAVPY